MSSGQQLTLDRLRRLVPPPAPTSGISLARLVAASYFLGDWQDAQATSMEQQLFVGAACTTQPVPPSLNVMLPGMSASDLNFQPANPDPRYSLWRGFDPANPSPDPNPKLVTAPSAILPSPTGTSTASGASGADLDAWGSAFGNSRWVGESDSNYALRILTDISRPSTTNRGLSAILDAALGFTGSSTGVEVKDASEGTYKRFNQQGASTLRMWNSTLSTTTAPRFGGGTGGNLTLAGCFYVNVPLVRASLDLTTAQANKLLSRRKAAGTQCIGVRALGEY